jgi:hypothetical protein
VYPVVVVLGVPVNHEQCRLAGLGLETLSDEDGGDLGGDSAHRQAGPDRGVNVRVGQAANPSRGVGEHSQVLGMPGRGECEELGQGGGQSVHRTSIGTADVRGPKGAVV